jgi:hypothetical protein
MYRSTITSTAAERLPIYELIFDHLAGAGAIHTLLLHGMVDKAEARGLELAEDIRLLNDIGWDRGDPRESFELTMPPEDLTELLKRMAAAATAGISGPAAESREVRLEDENKDHYALAAKVCGDLMGRLHPQGGGPA